MSPAAADYLFLIVWFCSYFIVYKIVFLIKARHVQAQNNLLERCRALYLLAIKHLESGNALASESILGRIRRIETVWRIGDSNLLRWCVTLESIAVAVLAVGAFRYLSFLANPNQPQALLERIAHDLSDGGGVLLVALFVPPLLHALIASSLDGWYDLNFLDNWGDRLERILRAGKSIAALPPKPSRTSTSLDGLSPFEILGVGRDYTGPQLKNARNRMAKILHPDRWVATSVTDREAANDAMKRVNAAYDHLRASLP